MYDDFEDIPVKDREIAVSVIGKIQNIAKDLKIGMTLPRSLSFLKI